MLDRNIYQKICKAVELGQELIPECNIPILVKSLDFNHIGVTKMLLDIVGMKSENELIGKDDFNVLWSELAMQLRLEDENVLKNQTLTTINPLPRKGWDNLIVSVYKEPLINPNGIIIGVIVLIQSLSINLENISPVNWCENKIKVGENMIALSLREQECLYFLLRGKSAKIIAKHLGLSPRTIETYIDRLKNKFGCMYKHEIIESAMSAGAFLITPNSIQLEEIE